MSNLRAICIFLVACFVIATGIVAALPRESRRFFGVHTQATSPLKDESGTGTVTFMNPAEETMLIDGLDQTNARPEKPDDVSIKLWTKDGKEWSAQWVEQVDAIGAK